MTEPPREPDPSHRRGRAGPAGAGGHRRPAHDPSGLELARSIADSVGAGPRRRSKKRYQRPTPVDPVRSGARPDDRDPTRAR